MSRARYFKVDLDHFHKSTFHRLADELGPWAPIAFLSLVAEAKRSSIPGRVIVTSMESLQERLGLLDYELPFTMPEFLKVTGRLKQTSTTKVGRLTHIVLTHYGSWQKDWKRDDDRERKTRGRTPDERRSDSDPTGFALPLHTTFDTNTDADTDTEETPANSGNPERNGLRPKAGLSSSSSSSSTTTSDGGRKKHECPHCGVVKSTATALDDHVELVHPSDPPVLRGVLVDGEAAA